MPGHLRSELRALIGLAVPIAAAQAGTQLMGVVDTAVVGRLGATQLAAVGLGNTIFFAISILGIGIAMGTDPLISQALGAGDADQARSFLWQGIWISIGVGVAISIPMAIAPFLFPLLGIADAVVSETRLYLLIRVISVIPSLLFIAVRSYLQAAGFVRPMIMAMLIGNVFNLIADLLLVFGGSGLPAWTGPLRAVPALGVAGAAVATVIGSVLQLAIIAAGVRRVPYTPSPASHRSPDRARIRQALRVGLPIGLQWSVEVGIFALVALLAGRLGSVELAAHQIAITLASFTFTGAVGVGAAGSVRVGRAVGALDQPGVRRAGFVAIGAGTAIMSFAGLAFLVIPGWLSRIISDQPEVIAVAIPLLGVAAFFQISDGIQAVGTGVLRGMGDTRFPFFANVIGHWLVGFPVAVLLGFHLRLGIVGLWWGLCAGLTAVATLLLIRFNRHSARKIVPLSAQRH